MRTLRPKEIGILLWGPLSVCAVFFLSDRELLEPRESLLLSPASSLSPSGWGEGGGN